MQRVRASAPQAWCPQDFSCPMGTLQKVRVDCPKCSLSLSLSLYTHSGHRLAFQRAIPTFTSMLPVETRNLVETNARTRTLECRVVLEGRHFLYCCLSRCGRLWPLQSINQSRREQTGSWRRHMGRGRRGGCDSEILRNSLFIGTAWSTVGGVLIVCGFPPVCTSGNAQRPKLHITTVRFKQRFSNGSLFAWPLSQSHLPVGFTGSNRVCRRLGRLLRLCLVPALLINIDSYFRMFFLRDGVRVSMLRTCTVHMHMLAVYKKE